MVQKLNYCFLKIKNEIWKYLLILIIVPGYSQALELKVKTILEFQPEQISCDVKGNIFMSDVSGNIYKYDNNGSFLNLYSTKRLGKIHALEANQGFRVFAFYQDLQEYLLIDQFLSNERSFQLNPDNYIRIATLSQDLNLWAIDERDLQLRKISSVSKIDIYQNQWANQFPEDKLNVQKIIEVKSKVYLFDKGSKVHIFDNLGNYISNIVLSESIDLAVGDTHLYCIYPGKLEIIDLEYGNVTIIEMSTSFEKIAYHNNLIYLTKNKILEIYNYIPL
jgi:hypothetical protein